MGRPRALEGGKVWERISVCKRQRECMRGSVCVSDGWSVSVGERVHMRINV